MATETRTDPTYEAQVAVIGSLLISPDLAGPIFEAVGPEDFTGECRRLFGHLADMWVEGVKPDPVLLAERAGGNAAETVRQIILITPTAANWKPYLERLKAGARLRKAQEAATQLMAADTPEQLEDILQRLNESQTDRKRAEVISAVDMATRAYERLTSGEKPEYLPWGIPILDQKLYAQKGDLIILGGYSSAGKTMLALQTAYHMADRYNVGFFSLETGEAKASDRLLSHISGVEFGKIKRRQLGESDHRALIDACQQLSGRRLSFIPAGGMTTGDIRALALSRRFDVIFVDYLQLIRQEGSPYDRVTAISMALHTFAQQCGVAVVALAQLSRPEKGENKKPLPPDMHSFRDSGQIEQDADAAVILYQEDPKDYKSDRILKIAKNKEGERAVVSMSFDGEHQTFRELDTSDEEALNRKALRKALHAGNRAKRAVTSADVAAAREQLERELEAAEQAAAPEETPPGWEEFENTAPMPW